MTDPSAESPARVLEKLASVLTAVGVTDFALTGGVALGVWSVPRQTRDIDICAVVPQEAVDRILSRHDGMRFGPEELPDVLRRILGR